MLLHVREYCSYGLLGSTLDDAAGEAFDKIAKFLEVGFPGGPVIDRLAKEGNRRAFSFPLPMLRARNYDFSFSGLKTAVLRTMKKRRIPTLEEGEDPFERSDILDLAAGFQAAVVETLVQRTAQVARRHHVEAILVSGGVAANRSLRERFGRLGEELGVRIIFPSVTLSTDNAAMVAAAGYLKLLRKELADLDLNADIELRLGEGRLRRSKRHR